MNQIIDIWIEYPISKTLFKIKTFDDEYSLSHAIKYVSEQNKKLEETWTGDSKIFFMSKENECSLDGIDWQPFPDKPY